MTDLAIMTSRQKVALTGTHTWAFKSRFRRGAFGWKSQPAITRIKEAVAEIKQVSRIDPIEAGEGAVIFLERLSPAIEHVDSSSGAIGAAVNKAVQELVVIIAKAPCSKVVRESWLERLYKAHEDDDIPYIECLVEYWGELCASADIASAWADRLIAWVKRAWREDGSTGDYFKGTNACLSGLYAAGRYKELLDLLDLDPHPMAWERKWGAQALARLDRTDEAIVYIEDCSSVNERYIIDRTCEDILVSAGRSDNAYALYAIPANQKSTNIATFRAIQKKYPSVSAEKILEDLIANSPGEEGKWFAAAKDAGLLELALELAKGSPCDPKTLSRASRDFLDSNPDFALKSGLLSLHWFMAGYGYDVIGQDVIDAYDMTLAAAKQLGKLEEVRDFIDQAVSNEGGDQFVSRMIAIGKKRVVMPPGWTWRRSKGRTGRKK